MKALRIIQIVILVALVGYLFWINNWNNNDWVGLPYFIDLPVGIVLGIALLLGYLAGWVFGRGGTWSKTREVSKLKKRIAELERSEPKVTAVNISRDAEPPVIPDRTGTVQRGTSEYENL